MFRTFVRNWWKVNPDWPDGLEPSPGPKRYIGGIHETEGEARAFAQAYNRENPPGRLSRKCEFERVAPRRR